MVRDQAPQAPFRPIANKSGLSLARIHSDWTHSIVFGLISCPGLLGPMPRGAISNPRITGLTTGLREREPQGGIGNSARVGHFWKDRGSGRRSARVL
jgi:hypothetical protein